VQTHSAARYVTLLRDGRAVVRDRSDHSGTGAKTRFSARAMRMAHNTVNTTALMLMVRLTNDLNATKVAVGGLTNIVNVVAAERRCTPAHISARPLKSRITAGHSLISGSDGTFTLSPQFGRVRVYTSAPDQWCSDRRVRSDIPARTGTACLSMCS
jgi:hypothetical protein